MKFFTSFGKFFLDDNGNPSMMRLISFINSIASIFFGTLMFVGVYIGTDHIVNKYEFYISCFFALLAVIGKYSQKLVERYIDKKA